MSFLNDFSCDDQGDSWWVGNDGFLADGADGVLGRDLLGFAVEGLFRG